MGSSVEVCPYHNDQDPHRWKVVKVLVIALVNVIEVEVPNVRVFPYGINLSVLWDIINIAENPSR